MANGTDELNAAVDRVRDLLVDQGMDEATAEATVFGARPASVSIRGNLADLQRMNAREVTVGATAATVTGEGEVIPLGEDAPPAGDGGGGDGGGGGPVDDSMTKAELSAEAQRRGVQVDDGMTKAEMIEAINNA